MTEKKAVMEAKGISRTYPGERPVYALKETDLIFMPGEFTAIIGRSGSGKSTLLRILGTLDRPDTGEIIIEGKTISCLKDAEVARFRRRRIGFVHQDYNLFPEYTAWENVVFPIHLDGAREDRNKVKELLSRLGILQCRDRFPHELSGGEQQRVSLARALVTEPAVILADEPTGSLDGKNRNEIIGILKDFKNDGKTVIIVSHDPVVMDHCERVIRIGS